MIKSALIYGFCCAIAIAGCYYGPDVVGIDPPHEPPVGVWALACVFIGLKIFSEASR